MTAEPGTTTAAPPESPARDPLRRLVRRWRSSLTARVAVATFVLSGIAVLLVGVTILQSVRGGLVDAARRTALNQLDSGRAFVQQQLTAVTPGDTGLVNRTVLSATEQLGGSGSPEQRYAVFLESRTAGTDSRYAPSGPGGFPAGAVPAALKRAVDHGRIAWVSTLVTRHGRAFPALAVGAPVNAPAADYDVFYVFQLDQQAQTLALVQRTILLSGIGLVALIVCITVLITRQVVGPVRAAARTAERLAGGKHRERMPVRGHDEIASLGMSFNRMAEQVQQQIARLRELSRVQQRFVADVSHELRTPITTVRMAADVLHDARGELPPDLARAAELLQAQLDRFEALLADLLEISRHDAGAAVLEAEPVDLSGIVRRVLQAAEPLADRRGVRFDVELPSAPVIVEADPRRLDRVLRNLVSNAIEHGAGRPVQVTVGTGPDSVAVLVRDHGPGLRPGEAALVFGRFWRADPARTRATGGTGLGLSIALEDARLHGGWLQAWGEPDRGTVFRLTLPWRAAGVVAASPLPLEPDDEPGALIGGSATQVPDAAH